MKCNACKKRMNVVLTEFDFDFCGVIKKGVNVPSCRCPQCGSIVVHDIIRARLRGYAAQESGNTVDFAKHEQQEAEDFAVLHTLGIM